MSLISSTFSFNHRDPSLSPIPRQGANIHRQLPKYVSNCIQPEALWQPLIAIRQSIASWTQLVTIWLLKVPKSIIPSLSFSWHFPFLIFSRSSSSLLKDPFFFLSFYISFPCVFQKWFICFSSSSFLLLFHCPFPFFSSQYSFFFYIPLLQSLGSNMNFNWLLCMCAWRLYPIYAFEVWLLTTCISHISLLN